MTIPRFSRQPVEAEAAQPIRLPEMHKETITPELAKEYLSLAKANRPIHPSVVDKYAKEMSAGKFLELAPDAPIAFDTDGNLINGQHRLAAIVKSGVTLTMWVSTNNDPDSFAVIDGGMNRRASDLLSVIHKKETGSYAQSAGRACSVARAMIAGIRDTKTDKVTVANYAHNHFDMIHRYINLTKKKTNPAWSGGTCAAFVKAAVYFGDLHVAPLAERWGNGVWTGPRDPIKTLQDALIKTRLRANSHDKYLTPNEEYTIAVACIRAAIQKRSLSRALLTEFEFGNEETDARTKAKLGKGVVT